MWRSIRQYSLMTLILVGLGCQHPKGMTNTKQPPDPLLISKKPVEGKPTSYEPRTMWREPQAPESPAREAVVLQAPTGRAEPVGYRSAEQGGVSIGKPRWLPESK